MKGKVYFGTGPEISFVGFGDARDLGARIDPALPGSERTALAEWQGGKCVTLTLAIPDEARQPLIEMFSPGGQLAQRLEKLAPLDPLDPCEGTRRLNEQGRSENRERDIAEVELRSALRGKPLLVTRFQARYLMSIDFDESLYVATDAPFDYLKPKIQSRGGQSRLHNRWGQIK